MNKRDPSVIRGFVSDLIEKLFSWRPIMLAMDIVSVELRDKEKEKTKDLQTVGIRKNDWYVTSYHFSFLFHKQKEDKMKKSWLANRKEKENVIFSIKFLLTQYDHCSVFTGMH